MGKRVIVSLCLVTAITVFAVAAWISCLNSAPEADRLMWDMEYQILYRGWTDCLEE